MESKEAQENIGRLQLMEQQAQTLVMQRQQFQTQLFELENALKELGVTETAFKIIGNIMVSSKKDALEKELKQKKEIVELRIKNVETEEKKIREKAKKLQEEVLSALKKKE
ncbi:MAG: prefoldin subunit [Candidatus Woesearchaeota archaeon]